MVRRDRLPKAVLLALDFKDGEEYTVGAIICRGDCPGKYSQRRPWLQTHVASMLKTQRQTRSPSSLALRKHGRQLGDCDSALASRKRLAESACIWLREAGLATERRLWPSWWTCCHVSVWKQFRSQNNAGAQRDEAEHISDLHLGMGMGTP